MRISDWSSDVCSSDLRVSTATVDRVLNRRASVRDSTVQQVLKAAAELDYLPEKNLRTALNPKPMRISFLLPKGTNRFINMMGDTIHYSQDNWAPLNVQSREERKSVGKGKSVSVRVALGGRRWIKKK